MLSVTVEQDALTQVSWGREEPDLAGTPAEEALLQEALDQTSAYFSGRGRDFDLPLKPAGSAFQKRVWEAISAIPYGDCRRYGDLAADLGSVARAVGGACGANPIPLIIPCHRVVGGGDRLVGFSAEGGVADKRLLLDFERGQPGLPFG